MSASCISTGSKHRESIPAAAEGWVVEGNSLEELEGLVENMVAAQAEAVGYRLT